LSSQKRLKGVVEGVFNSGKQYHTNRDHGSPIVVFDNFTNQKSTSASECPATLRRMG
jgi:hypothetical protein